MSSLRSFFAAAAGEAAGFGGSAGPGGSGGQSQAGGGSFPHCGQGTSIGIAGDFSGAAGVAPASCRGDNGRMPPIARLLLRFVLLCAMGLWLGGLTFYTLRVIRAAHQVVGNHTKVGFITQQATRDLNLIGAGALLLMFGSGWVSGRAAGMRTRAVLAASWITAAAAHVGVFLIHARLDGMLDGQSRQVREGVAFHGPHETYLIATAVEWGAALVYLLAALAAWTREDSVSSDRR
jgi:hypothetical protein